MSGAQLSFTRRAPSEHSVCVRGVVFEYQDDVAEGGGGVDEIVVVQG